MMPVVKDSLSMSSTYLRVYRGPDGQISKEELPAEVDQVTLPASEIIPLLADAYASRRTWLRDFSDEPITLSADLYEVLVAYQFFRRPSA